MISILSVTEHSNLGEVVAAHALFRRYAEFLGSISACHGFDFERFAQETAALPAPYSGHGGELLLAMQHEGATDEAEGTAVGCLGYRAATAVLASFAGGAEAERGGSVCELKRLFVSPEARGQKVGQLLVGAALSRAAQRGYRTAMLDTEPSSMQAAYRIYTGLGFTEFQPAIGSGGGPKVVYLRRSIR